METPSLRVVSFLRLFVYARLISQSRGSIPYRVGVKASGQCGCSAARVLAPHYALIEAFNYNLFDIYSTSSLITLSWSFTSLLLLMLRTYIKQIGGGNSGEDSNGGFFYIN